MALETLKGLDKIGGFCVNEPAAFIEINHNANSIKFVLQNGPVNEVGLNGCQIDTIIEASTIILEGLNQKFPCRENSIAITKLEESLMWLNKRTAYRERKDVEGHSKA